MKQRKCLKSVEIQSTRAGFKEKPARVVEINGDKTQAEMAKLWTEEISKPTISRALKKIGFTRKKNLWLSRTR